MAIRALNGKANEPQAFREPENGAMLMNRYAVVLLLTSGFLWGCAGKPIVFEEVPTTKYSVPYAKILVEDFTQDRKISSSDVIWVNGWVPLFDGTRGPSPNKTMYRYLKEALTASLEGNDTLRVALIDSTFLMEKNLSDDMAFINMISAQRQRGFKCTASLNISNSLKSERKEFEAGERASGFVEMEFLQEFTTRCRRLLVSDIQSYLQKF